MSIRDSTSTRITSIKRRRVLQVGFPLIVGVIGMSPASAEPIDGKGNDVCPCVFGIKEADLNSDNTIDVSGPCEVKTPPEEVTVQVKVHGKRGARAVGSETFICDAEKDSFSVSADIRGVNRFKRGEEIEVRAQVHINPEDNPAITGSWSWFGDLS